MFINNDERTGRFTFEAEGSLDPHSPWYIGKLSHPSAQSGVTVGAGYDMGGRTPMQVRNELVTAGCNSVLAEKLSRGAGLRGHPADQFVKANKSILAINEVQVLRNLFAQIYPTYVAI